MNLKPIFLSFGLMALTATSASAQTGNYPVTNGSSADAGDSVPGTDIVRPPTDIPCDKAFDDGDWNKALPLCLNAEKGYQKIIVRIKNSPPGRTFQDPSTGDTHTYGILKDTMTYDAAYTNWQIATCYKMKGTSELGRLYGGLAYNQYKDVHDAYWHKLNAVLKRDPDDHSKIDYGKLPDGVQRALDAALTQDQASLAADFVALMMKVHLIYPEIFAQEAKLIDGNPNVDEH